LAGERMLPSSSGTATSYTVQEKSTAPRFRIGLENSLARKIHVELMIRAGAGLARREISEDRSSWLKPAKKSRSQALSLGRSSVGSAR